jgi:hypothetical protein
VRREGFGHGLAVSFARQTVVGPVTGAVGLVTMAVWFAALAAGGRDGTTAKVAERQDLAENGVALLQE